MIRKIGQLLHNGGGCHPHPPPSTLPLSNFRAKIVGPIKYLIMPIFPLSGKSNYVIEEFSAERQRAIICWGHYFIT